jgi:hypothetical protein
MGMRRAMSRQILEGFMVVEDKCEDGNLASQEIKRKLVYNVFDHFHSENRDWATYPRLRMEQPLPFSKHNFKLDVLKRPHRS